MLKKLDFFILCLLIFSGITWGIWGIFEFNLVTYIFNHDWLHRIIYVIWGGAAIYYMVAWKYAVKRKK